MNDKLVGQQIKTTEKLGNVKKQIPLPNIVTLICLGLLKVVFSWRGSPPTF